MVVTKVPMVSFVELKWTRISRVAAVLMVESKGLEDVRILGQCVVCHLREQRHRRDDDYLHRFLSRRSVHRMFWVLWSVKVDDIRILGYWIVCDIAVVGLFTVTL